MADKVEVDPVALKAAGDLIADIGGTLTGLANKATDIMGHMTVACGDDHFGHEFTAGEKGYKRRCDNSVDFGNSLGKAFTDQGEYLGSEATAAVEGTEKTSSADLRRAV